MLKQDIITIYILIFYIYIYILLYDYLINYVNIYYGILVVNKFTILFIIVQKLNGSVVVILDIAHLLCWQFALELITTFGKSDIHAPN